MPPRNTTKAVLARAPGRFSTVNGAREHDDFEGGGFKVPPPASMREMRGATAQRSGPLT
jgi:hypothetical protein